MLFDENKEDDDLKMSDEEAREQLLEVYDDISHRVRVMFLNRLIRSLIFFATCVVILKVAQSYGQRDFTILKMGAGLWMARLLGPAIYISFTVLRRMKQLKKSAINYEMQDCKEQLKTARGARDRLIEHGFA